jgi:ribosome recycling factor
MIDDIIADVKSRMHKSIEAFKFELKKLRTGRAHPGLLEQVRLDYYGTPTPLSQVASVSVENNRTLMVTPWEKDMVGPIEKAIMKADLGLNPNSVGLVIRVPLPPLTEERRRDLAKVVHAEAERARVAVRNLRREANNDFKELQKDKEISEDDARRAETRMQKITDDVIAEIESLMQSKEKDLMAV